MKSLIEEKVVCPHCWNNFYAEHASYITQHTELYGDPVLGENAFRRFSYLEIQRDRSGKVLDPKGEPMLERVCPGCNVQIPYGSLVGRPKFISIVGAPSSGKTYFLTVMLHQLREELSKFFKHTFEVCDYHEKSLFSKYAQILFSPDDPHKASLLEKTAREGELYNTIQLNGAKVVLPKPFIFAVRPTVGHGPTSTPQTTSIVYYDNSGESFNFRSDDDGTKRYTQHLGESDAVLFTYDFLLNPTARQRLQLISQDPQVSGILKTARQEDILTEAIQRIRRYRRLNDGQLIDSSLIVCVQKYDVWKSLLHYLPKVDANLDRIDHSSIEYFREHGVAGLDVQEMNAISLLVRKLLSDYSHGFVTSAEAHFSRVRYFPVSALGASPKLEGEFLKIQPDQIRPFRVTHPMLWMLHEWKVIRRTKKMATKPKELPSAEIKVVSADRIQVSSPYRTTPFIVDFEYAGSRVFDPEMGQPFWIPNLSLGGPAKVSPTNSATKSGQSSTPPPVDLSGHKLATKPSKKVQKPWWSKWFS